MDKYLKQSIKNSERKLRGAVDVPYVFITGSGQVIRRSGLKLLENRHFKNESGKFLLIEWGKNHYWNIIGEKKLIFSHVGDCVMYVSDQVNQAVITFKPHQF